MLCSGSCIGGRIWKEYALLMTLLSLRYLPIFYSSMLMSEKWQGRNVDHQPYAGSLEASWLDSFCVQEIAWLLIYRYDCLRCFCKQSWRKSKKRRWLQPYKLNVKHKRVRNNLVLFVQISFLLSKQNGQIYDLNILAHYLSIK